MSKGPLHGSRRFVDVSQGKRSASVEKQRLYRVDEHRWGPASIQFEGAGCAKQRFHRADVVCDLGLFIRSSAVGIRRAGRYALNQDLQRCPQEHDVVEPIVELHLVLDSARNYNLVFLIQQAGDPGRIPAAVVENPFAVISIHNCVASAGKPVEQRGFASTRHSGDQNRHHALRVGLMALGLAQ
jgi:hypothetical protein